jgi:MOSC domain-containing protein YiiM
MTSECMRWATPGPATISKVGGAPDRLAVVDAGKVEAVYIGPEPQQPMHAVDEVNALAGQGLEGDRYFRDGATPAEDRDPTQEVTLIEIEGIEAAGSESGLDIDPEDMRRNIVTRGVRLEGLVGKRFSVGEVQLEGLEDNPPCAHLERVSNKKVLKPMIERGGIRARILKSGSIRRGDPIRTV